MKYSTLSTKLFLSFLLSLMAIPCAAISLVESPLAVIAQAALIPTQETAPTVHDIQTTDIKSFTNDFYTLIDLMDEEDVKIKGQLIREARVFINGVEIQKDATITIASNNNTITMTLVAPSDAFFGLMDLQDYEFSKWIAGKTVMVYFSFDLQLPEENEDELSLMELFLGKLDEWEQLPEQKPIINTPSVSIMRSPWYRPWIRVDVCEKK